MKALFSGNNALNHFFEVSRVNQGFQEFARFLAKVSRYFSLCRHMKLNVFWMLSAFLADQSIIGDEIVFKVSAFF